MHKRVNDQHMNPPDVETYEYVKYIYKHLVDS